jgi:hypothetical protein
MKFIRKNGRIIPIRDNYKKEGRVVGAGGALLVGGAAIHGATAKRTKPFSPAKFKTDYAHEFRASGNPDLVISDKPLEAHAVHGIKTTSGFQSGKSFFRSEKFSQITIGKGSDREATMLHELGHIRSSTRKASFNKVMASQSKLGSFTRMPGVRTFANLGSEAEASGEAIRMAAKSGGAKKALKIGAQLVAPYATYVGSAMIVGGLAAAAVKWANSKRRKK